MGYFPFVTASSSSSGYPAEPVVSGTPTAGQVLTAETATTATWENSVEIAGDLGGTDADPLVISTHLAAATPAWASTVNLDPTSTRVFVITQTGNTTYTFTPAGSLTSGESYSFELYAYMDATGGWATTFTVSGLSWVGGGTAPTPNTAASALNLYVFETTDGGTIWTGALVQPLNLPLTVADGGTGGAALAAYELIAGGITTTSPAQSIGSGTTGQALASNGASALPSFQTLFLDIANNLSDLASAATARTNLGLGSAATLASSAVAQTANNLSDLASAATARTNLGLGAVATEAYISGEILALVTYAPATQVVIETFSTTLATLNAAPVAVAAGSNGGTITGIGTWANPSGGVLDVSSTAGWPNAGTASVVTSGTTAVITYTGTTAVSLTGCVYVSGSGTVATGNAVTCTAAGTGAAAVPAITTGSFTPPGSSVLVTVSLVCSQGTTADYLTFGLANHGSLTPVCPNNVTQCLSGARPLPYVLTFLVTGLSGAQNFDLLFGVEASDLTVYAYATQSTTAASTLGSPVTMIVQAI